MSQTIHLYNWKGDVSRKFALIKVHFHGNEGAVLGPIVTLALRQIWNHAYPNHKSLSFKLMNVFVRITGLLQASMESVPLPSWVEKSLLQAV